MLDQRALRFPARIALKILPFSLALYALAILSSMAAMEIFGWLSAVLVLVVLVSQWDRQIFSQGSPWLIVDGVLLAFFITVVIGAIMAEPGHTKTIDIIGHVRWVFLYMLIRTGLSWIWSPRLEMIHMLFLTLMGLIGVYAVVQHFTGIDFIRGFPSRAVLPLSYIPGTDTPISWRAAGLYSSSMTYGHSAAMALGIPVALYLVHTSRGRDLRLFAGAMAVLIAGGIIASFTRGAWLAAGMSVLVIGAFAGRRALLVLLLITGVAGGAVVTASSEVRTRLASIVDPANESNQERLALWRVNLEMVKDKPLFGVGYGENEYLAPKYYERLGMTGRQGHAHNNLLQIMAGTGLIGTFFFVLFGLYFLFINLRLWGMIPSERTWERGLVLGIFGAQIAMHVGGLTECNFKDGEINHHFMFLLAVLSCLYQYYSSEHGWTIVRPKNETRPLNSI